MSDTSAIFHERLQSCEEQYILHFAGQVRATRDPAMLDALISEVEAVGSQTSDPVVADTAAAQAVTYRQEREAIEAACAAAGPTGRVAAGLARRASLVMHRYTRHFAGQGRPSRDVGLLRETIGDLGDLGHAMRDVAPGGAESVQEFVELLRREEEAIVASRREGAVLQQAAHWASAANTLLSAYSVLCLQHRRLSVRPGLIERLCGELETVYAEMTTLRAEGVGATYHEEALSQLEGQIGLWREELRATQGTHRQANPQDVTEALSAELDEILERFNDGPTQQELAGLCDRMDECERQLRAQGTDMSAMMVASDALAMLCTRYDSMD